MDEKVSVPGVFLKVWRYKAERQQVMGSRAFAPLVIGPQLIWSPQEKQSSTWSGLIGVVLVTVSLG